MSKIIIPCIAALFLSGCAGMYQRAPELNATSGITYGKLGENEIIKSYKILKTSVPKDSNSLQRCVLKNVSNNGVILSDSSNSFAGAYTGNYYNITASNAIAGGEVVKANTASETISVGIVKYNTGVVTRAVRFLLDARVINNHVSYEFDKLEQAQLSTGAIPNNGFYPVGSWSMAGSVEVIASLNTIAESIDDCLKGN